MAQLVKNPLVVQDTACNAGETRAISGLGRSSGEENGNLLQYSCLGNLTDRGAWWATVHGVSKSWARLSTHAGPEPHLNAKETGICNPAECFGREIRPLGG